METTLAVIFSLFVALGIPLAAVPGIPAVLYMLVVSFLFGAINHFSVLSLYEMGVLALIYLLSFCVDLFSGAFGAKYGGASVRSMGWGILGAVIGAIVMPPFGGIFGLFIAVLISEVSRHGDGFRALRAAGFGALGALTGALINVGLATLFFAVFVAAVFFLH